MDTHPESAVSALPRLAGDQSLAFLLEGYCFGEHRFERLRSDAFRARLLGRPVVIARGPDAARFFYEGGRFTRSGSMPRSVLHSLQDAGSVQTLEAEAHRARKQLFRDILTSPERERLTGILSERWQTAMAQWATKPVVSLNREAATVLTAAALEWAGIPSAGDDTPARAEEFRAMIDGAGSFGPRNWRGRLLRLRTEHWARDLIGGVRTGEISTPPGSPLHRVATFAEPESLSVDVAAVELLNVLRPIVAASRFIMFAALALVQHPAWRDRLLGSSPAVVRAFVQEVRRLSPFFPAVGGTAATDLEWRGHRFDAGDWMLLDLFATNRSPQVWERPLVFRPGRFLEDPSAEARIVAQGTGDDASTHHCPGEPLTVELMQTVVPLLAATVFHVADNPHVDLRRLPAQPRGGLRLRFGSAAMRPTEPEPESRFEPRPAREPQRERVAALSTEGR